MSCSLKAGFAVSGSSSTNLLIKNRGTKECFRVCSGSLQLKKSTTNPTLFITNQHTVDFSDRKPAVQSPKLDPVQGKYIPGVGKSMRWWEKSLQPNMVEIQSAQQLVDCLVNAGDRLVILDFYSPGCGGCKALHPKICQLAELNPDATFLKVNYEEHKPMCYALRVHVLPFFRFYRGADGRVCSFSCTNATIKKFKDALAKHGTEQCSLGPAKGLDESELMALASIGLISREMVPSSTNDDKDLVLNGATAMSHTLKNKDDKKIEVMESNAMAMA
uniref:Thioredoxin 2 n=1 Tax=Plantago major TaxID=29818 RepID=Q5ZF47_PLAMJ|nr:thioredoxin 2 [Plantago major]